MIRWIIETIETILHNRALYRSGKANRNEIRLTAIGWRPDETYQKGDGEEWYKIVRKK